MSRGVQLWYYAGKVPSRAVGVAQVTVPPMTPAQLTSINNMPYEVGPLSVWKSSSGYSGAADFTAHRGYQAGRRQKRRAHRRALAPQAGHVRIRKSG